MKRWLPVPVVLAALLGIYLLLPGKPSEKDSPAPIRQEARPSKVVTKLAPPTPTEVPTPGVPLEPGVLETLFPDLAKSVCASPPEVPEGRLRAGGDVVLNRAGQTTVISAEDTGSAPVFLLGRQAGNLEWSNGTCTWTAQPDVMLRGRVTSGGVHVVAGCPIGETVKTDANGGFELAVPAGQRCTARVVRSEGGLAMGKTVLFDGKADMEIDLEAPTGKGMSKEEINTTAAMLEKVTSKQLDEARIELERLQGLGADLAGAEWLLEEAAQRVGFFEEEVERLRNPLSQAEAVEEFLFSQSN